MIFCISDAIKSYIHFLLNSFFNFVLTYLFILYSCFSVSEIFRVGLLCIKIVRVGVLCIKMYKIINIIIIIIGLLKHI